MLVRKLSPSPASWIRSAGLRKHHSLHHHYSLLTHVQPVRHPFNPHSLQSGFAQVVLSKVLRRSTLCRTPTLWLRTTSDQPKDILPANCPADRNRGSTTSAGT
jgi:hypothetical protein